MKCDLRKFKKLALDLLNQDRLNNIKKKGHLELFESHYEDIAYDINHSKSIMQIQYLAKQFKFDPNNILQD